MNKVNKNENIIIINYFIDYTAVAYNVDESYYWVAGCIRTHMYIAFDKW